MSEARFAVHFNYAKRHKKPQQMSFSHNKINTKVTENINANDDLSVFPFRYLHNCKKKLQLHRECMNNLFVKSQ